MIARRFVGKVGGKDPGDGSVIVRIKKAVGKYGDVVVGGVEGCVR